MPELSVEAGGLNLVPMLVTAATTKTFKWEFFSWDHQGSVRVVTNEAGGVKRTLRFFPYGEEIGTTGSSADETQKKGFTAHERDTRTGADYMLGRYYSSEQARFLRVDPLRTSVDGARPTTWNRYSYASGDPINRIDPDGLTTVSNHVGWTSWFLVYYGVDPGFAYDVGQATGDVDYEHTWLWPPNHEPYHAFGCGGACLQDAMASLVAADASSAGALGIGFHFIEDQPFHNEFKRWWGHAFAPGTDRLSHNSSKTAKFFSVLSKAAMQVAKNRGEYNGGEAPPKAFLAALGRADAFPRQRLDDQGNPTRIFDMVVPTMRQARELQTWLLTNGYGYHWIVDERSADGVFDERAGEIRGGNGLGFSTMPNDCGARRQDGTC